MSKRARSRDHHPHKDDRATSRLLEELLAQQTPVAEIAVRLGISIPAARARISRVTGDAQSSLPEPQQKVPLPPSLPNQGQSEAVPQAPDTAVVENQSPGQASPRRLSRRGFLALTAAGIAGLATGGVFLAKRGGESETISRPARPVPVPPTLTPVPAPLSVLQPASDIFQKITLKPGALLTEQHGIFFMRTRGEDAGSMTGWKLTDPGNSEPLTYQTSTEARFVIAGSALHDRFSGRSWSWPKDKLRLVGCSDEAALFEMLNTERDQRELEMGRYILTNGDLKAQAEFELPGAPLPAVPPMFEPGGRRVFLALDQPQHYPALFVLDGATSQARVVMAPGRQIGMQRVLFQAPTLLEDKSAFLMPYSYWPMRLQGIGYGVFATFMARIGWEGDRQGVTRVRVDRAFSSPNGSLVAGERVLPTMETAPLSFQDTSTVLVIDGKTGQNRFRIRSARLNYGDDLGGARWLADSSGLIVQTRINGKPGYSIVDAKGTIIEQLPDPPGGSGRWFEHSDLRGAVPAPDDPSLISFGRTAAYDRSSGHWLTMRIETGAPAHTDPWTQTRSEEMLLSLPHHPHRIFPLLAEIDETRIERTVPYEGDGA